MKNLFTSSLIAICSCVIFSCQNDLPLTGNTTTTVSIRATPSDAIEISPDSRGNLVIEGGKNYVIRGEVSATGFSSTASVSNEAQLFIEGTLSFDDPTVIDLLLPDGLLITVNNGGNLIFTSNLVRFGNVNSLYIQSDGSFEARRSNIRFLFGNTESTLINYGNMYVYNLIMRGSPFYNMVTGKATVCIFSTDAEVNNYGTFVNCSGTPYNY